MYKKFYNLKRNPFEITPDPTFLFPTIRHNEALASLYYGVTAHRGFVVLTGEVGTGKTLILRSLLGLVQRRDVAFALVFNPSLSPLEFMRYIARDLGLAVAGKAKDEILHGLNDYLLQRHQQRLTSLLVVDEAHDLSADLLEEIRLLTNLETSQQKLLQIVLAGQPELDLMLDSHELRQLKQRIALRCHLDPLGWQETKEYMRRRLSIAGAPETSRIFTETAVESVFRYARGIPRLINTICENALLAGYAKNSPLVTEDIVEGVARDLRLTAQAIGARNGDHRSEPINGPRGEAKVEREVEAKIEARTETEMTTVRAAVIADTIATEAGARVGAPKSLEPTSVESTSVESTSVESKSAAGKNGDGKNGEHKNGDLKSNGGSPKPNEKSQSELLLAVRKLLEVHDRMQEMEIKGRLQ